MGSSTKMKAIRTVVLAAAAAFAIPAIASASVNIAIGVSVNTPPPALPVYAQPPCPEDGYLWTPGYWAWGPAGYYWVPGVWVRPPAVGVLWTPGYWGWNGTAYIFHAGYWGPHIASMAASTTATATPALAMRAVTGEAESSPTTAQLTISASST